MTDPIQQFRQNGRTELAHAQLLGQESRGFLGLPEMWRQLQHAVGNLIRAAEPLDVPGVVKKEEVLKYVDQWLDFVLPAIPLPWFLVWLRLFQGSIKQRILQLVDGMIDDLYEEYIKPA